LVGAEIAAKADVGVDPQIEAGAVLRAKEGREVRKEGR
jgi:hypothetical protein